MDLFSNCTEECKALGHSDRCWMPSFVPSDGRQAADYRSNLHVPGMDSVPDTEVFETPEAQPGAERSFSTFGKEKGLHSTLERKELDGLLSNTRGPYKPPYLSKRRIFNSILRKAAEFLQEGEKRGWKLAKARSLGEPPSQLVLPPGGAIIQKVCRRGSGGVGSVASLGSRPGMLSTEG
uniref:Uncharacterized protein n=1 Tax=Sphaerodactylus townsendi TaxID=933632 RepID=A0ACB8E884_9SAUR